MFIAMNRFKVKKGSEHDFEQVWLTRKTHLDEVPGFVVFHLLHDGARCVVGGRQLLVVAGEMGLDLTLGLDDEAEADAIARKARRPADAERAGVPQRVQQAAVSLQLDQALMGPRQVVGFFTCRCLAMRTELRAAGRQRLRLVERLRTDLAHMIDAHQRT